ncbi:MAG: hypothetical protein HY695_04485 [Deltaproteobacteria bacterium]|nr:hypothetical protein [Deltaproteobacteria bacterium]
MSRRDPLVRLKHMLDYAREAVDMAKGKKAEDLDRDRKLALAWGVGVVMQSGTTTRISCCQTHFLKELWTGNILD